MAIAFVLERASAASAAGGALWSGLAMATGAAITPGNTLILELAYRDAATPPVDARPQPGDARGADLRGNLWRRVAVSANAGPSIAANNGAVSAIWICHVVNPYLNGDTIDIMAPIVSTPTTAIVGRITEWSGVRRDDAPLATYATQGSGTTATVPGIAPTAAGQLVFGSVSVQAGPALTGDADVTDGAWSAISQTASAAAIIRGSQYKIPSGTTTQSWAVTWAGAQPWASTAVVLEEATTPWPSNNERLANPDYACPAGAQIIPVGVTNTPVDTGTAYIFNALPPTESSGSAGVYWDANLNSLDPAVDTQHIIVAEVYPEGLERVYNNPLTLNMGVPYNAVLQGGAVVSGGGTATAALAAAGGSSILFNAVGDQVDCYWDFSTISDLLGLYRVLDVRINYVAWKDDSAAPQPGEGLAVYWRDETAVRASTSSRITALHGAWLVNEYKNAARRTYKSLGEINGVPRIGATSNVQYSNLAATFTLDDLFRMNLGTATTMLSIAGLNGSAPSQTAVFLDTIELEIVLVPEKRVAQGARRVSTGVGFAGGTEAVQGSITMPLYSATSSDLFWTVPSDGERVDVVLREGVPASPSDWFSAQYDPTVAAANFNNQNIRYASLERVGPSIAVRSVIQPRGTIAPDPYVTRVAWSNGQIAPNSVPEDANELIHQFTLADLNSYLAWWPAYLANNVGDLGVSVSTPAGTLIGVNGAASYDYLRMVVKAPDAPGAPDLNISIEQPAATVLATATITQAQVLALPDIGNGYREVHVPLSTTITPSSASDVQIFFSSTTADNDPWVPAWGETTSGRAAYQPNPQEAASLGINFAFVLSCPLPDVDLAVESNTIDIANNGNTPCVTTTSNIPCVIVENAEQYDWLTIERVVGGTDVTPVALIDVNGEIEYPQIEVEDDFSRTLPTTWGTPTVGSAWVGTAAPGGTYAVNSGRGILSFSATSNTNTSDAGHTSGPYTRQRVRVAVPQVPTGGTMRAGVYANDAVDDQYLISVTWNTDGTGTVAFSRLLANVPTTIGTFDYTDLAAGQYVYLALEVAGGVARGKSWLDGQTEPEWQFSQAVPGTMSAFTTAAVYGQRRLANTSVVPDIYFDDYLLEDLNSQQVEWCDYGVPWDLAANTISYRVQGFRNSDHRSTPYASELWNDTSNAAGAAFGLASDDGLYAYAPGSNSGELELTWNRIYPVEMMPLAGKDYQVALRPSEVRGYSITTNVLVDKLSYCTVGDESGEDDGTYDGLGIYDDDNFYDYSASSPTSEEPGAKGMAPTPFQQLNQIERNARMTLKLPGGHTRVVYVDTGAQTLIPVIGLAMAELTLTDTTPTEISVPEYPETL